MVVSTRLLNGQTLGSKLDRGADEFPFLDALSLELKKEVFHNELLTLVGLSCLVVAYDKELGMSGT